MGKKVSDIVLCFSSSFAYSEAAKYGLYTDSELYHRTVAQCGCDKAARIQVRGYTLSAQSGRNLSKLVLYFTLSFSYPGADQV